MHVLIFNTLLFSLAQVSHYKKNTEQTKKRQSEHQTNKQNKAKNKSWRAKAPIFKNIVITDQQKPHI